MGEIIKISITDLTSAIDKEFRSYRFCDWVTGKPERIDCYTVNDWHENNKINEKFGDRVLVFRNAEEVRKFAKWLLENVKGKDKLELLRFKKVRDSHKSEVKNETK
ncbi:hypothetical protein LCGC14_0569670 [marine sediment metagenome]|uniref:Uncharacterized protein n=1 Tax=marine sediment metagenome TaxID=412755 RepID=A0A0F9RJF1_9ZZZZ